VNGSRTTKPFNYRLLSFRDQPWLAREHGELVTATWRQLPVVSRTECEGVGQHWADCRWFVAPQVSGTNN
jgi:hypothetical protein